MKGLHADVYRDANGGDYTNGGITGRCKTILIVGEGPDTEVFDEDPKYPSVRILRRYIGGSTYIYAVPMEQPAKDSMAGPCFGGNFIYSQDSRFRNICPYPIPVHDRWDTWKQYNILST